MPRPLFIVLRLSFVGFFLFTSLYCLFAYTPFTYTHVIQAGLLPWLESFAAIHHRLFWVASAASIATLWGDRRAPLPMALSLAYVVATVVAGALLSVLPV